MNESLFVVITITSINYLVSDVIYSEFEWILVYMNTVAEIKDS